MNRVIRSYKYPPYHRDWAVILGRILAGHLDNNVSTFGRFDIIVPSPTYSGSGAARPWDHIEAILIEASRAATGAWPFDLAAPHAIVLTSPTESFVDQENWNARKTLAEGPLRSALDVPNPSVVGGASVLVIDDVFTEGFKAREVARRLLQAGASDVSQLVLARRQFS